MALDISDALDSNGDLQLVRTDKYRAYNLLTRYFQDNEYIDIKTENMILIGIIPAQIDAIIVKYLTDFSVKFGDFSFYSDSKGIIHYDFNFNMGGREDG